MKRVLMFALSLILILQSAFSCVLFVSAEENQIVSTSAVEEVKIPEAIKILAIGNSFSHDAMQWLYNILTDLGVKEVVLGNMYIGSCSLKTHMSNATSGAESYTYYKATAENAGVLTAVEGKKSLMYGLQDEEWDYISLQEASATSGVSESYEPYLTDLIAFVNKNKTNPNAKLMWHMTWAYQSTSGHNSFPTYGKDQQVMYNSILRAAKTKVLPHEEFSFIIPSGTAIQNIRSSNVGDTVTRDGYHMSLALGRYAVGAMWAKSILNADISTLKPRPDIEPAITDEEFSIIVEGVNNAYANPYEVTQSKIVSAERLAEIEDAKPYTIVKATDMGKYNAEDDTFYFDNGSLVHNKENIVYLPDAAIRTKYGVCCYVDGEFYAPQYVLDCMSGKEEYKKFSGEIAKCDLDTKTSDGKMKGEIVIKNYLRDDAIAGVVRFKDEKINAAIGDVKIDAIKGRETGRTEIELPLELTGAYDVDLSYEFVTEYGTYTYDATRYYIFVDKVDAVTVDGIISEGEWEKATKLVLDEKSVVGIDGWTGAEDLSAVAYVSYDNDSFYLAAEVVDDSFKPTTHRVWLDGDSIQVDFYVDESGHFDPGAYDAVFTEAGIAYYENVAGVHRFKSQTGKLGRDMVGEAQVAVTQEGNKTTYETIIKWADLFGEEFTPKADDAIGFAFVVNEKDDESPEGWLKFASGTGGNDKRNPNKFAQMYFVGKEEKVDDGSFVENGIRYIPFRKVFEALGAEITWDDSVKTAYAAKNGKTVGAAIGAAEITVNGEAQAVAGDVKLIESRTYIPEVDTAKLFEN